MMKGVCKEMESPERDFATTVLQSLPYPLFILDEEGNYVDVIGGGDRSYYDSGSFLIGRNLFDVLPRDRASKFLETICLAIETGSLQVVEYELASTECDGNPQDGPSGPQWFEGHVFPLKTESTSHSLPGRRLVLWTALNITRRKRAEHGRKRHGGKHEEIVQICVFCRNVRNADKKWERLETYLERHTQLAFSHGMCPECATRRYSNLLSQYRELEAKKRSEGGEDSTPAFEEPETR